MEGTYPVILDGNLEGKLEVRQVGLFTKFCVRCAWREGLVRVSVYGPDRREGYLGVLVPDGAGGLCLEKSLSRQGLSGFPPEIDHCGLAGMVWPETVCETPEPDFEPAEYPPEADVLWHTAPGGILVTETKGRSLIAVPAAREGLPVEKALEVKEIGDTRYAVFEAKNGLLF